MEDGVAKSKMAEYQIEYISRRDIRSTVQRTTDAGAGGLLRIVNGVAVSSCARACRTGRGYYLCLGNALRNVLCLEEIVLRNVTDCGNPLDLWGAVAIFHQIALTCPAKLHVGEVTHSSGPSALKRRIQCATVPASHAGGRTDEDGGWMCEDVEGDVPPPPPPPPMLISCG